MTVKGVVDEATGMVINLDELKTKIQEVIEQVDHKFLDKDVPFFETHTSTIENVAIFFWEQLVHVLPEGVDLAKIKAFETEKNIAVYRG